MKEADEELAKVAYNAYGMNRRWVVFSGDAMPQWEDQRPELKEAWGAAARAVAEYIRAKDITDAS